MKAIQTKGTTDRLINPPPLVVLFIGDSGVHDGLRLDLAHQRVKTLVARWFGQARLLTRHCVPDVVMVGDQPIGAGLEGFTMLMREEWPSAKVILLGFSPLSRLSAASMGFLYSGMKPISSNLLLHILDSAFPGRLDGTLGCLQERPQVLCLDGDSLFLHSLCRILTRHGYRTASFEKPMEALEAIETIRPQLAIVGMETPEMDRMAFVRDVEVISHGKVPVVLLTGRQSHSALPEGYRHGENCSISKPCSPDRLLRIVDSFLQAG